MEKIRELLGKPLVIGVVGIVLGLVIGLTIGWGIWPVQYYDASAANLRKDLQQDWMRMAIQSYGQTNDAPTAQSRWKELGPNAQTILTEVSTDPRLEPEWVARFTALVLTGQAPAAQPTLPVKGTKVPGVKNTPAGTALPEGTGQPTAPIVGQVSPSQVVPTEAPPKAPGLNPVYLLAGFCLLLIVVGGVLFYLLVVAPKRAGGSTLFPKARQQADANRQAERTDFAAEGQEPPVAQFMTTYVLGDDLYDDSFSIDSPAGEFLGECGVGIADTIGVGDPKKVTAFEVWLFDKNDIQTVTKVLMSEHAFNDASISQRLASKGEPVVVEPGQHILLETQTLTLEARVVDMNYGQGALPSGSFFERLTLELAIWPKKSA